MSFFTPTPEQIRAFVQTHFPDYKERKDWLLINSPFDDDAKHKFGISLTGKPANNFKGNEWAGEPGKTGKQNRFFVNFVAKYLNCSYHDAVRAIKAAGDNGTGTMPSPSSRTQRRAEEQKNDSLVEMPADAAPLSESTKLAANNIRKWLVNRGITADLIEKHRICHTSIAAIWPYYEYELLVYWQSREMLNKTFRFPPVETCGVAKGDFLYGFDDAEIGSQIIITESIFGRFTLMDQTLASGGAALTPRQVSKLALLNPRDGIILAPDNDAAGLKSIISNAQLLEPRGYKVFYCVPPTLHYIEGGVQRTTKDWNELLVKAKLDKADIRVWFESNVYQLNTKTRLALNKQIVEMKK